MTGTHIFLHMLRVAYQSGGFFSWLSNIACSSTTSVMCHSCLPFSWQAPCISHAVCRCAGLTDGESSGASASSTRTRSPSPPRVRKALSEYGAHTAPQGPQGTPFAGVAPKAAPANEAGSPHKQPTGNPFARSEPPAASGARSPHRGASPKRNGARMPVPRLPLPLPLLLPKKGTAPASGSPGSTPGAPRAHTAAPEPAAQSRGAEAKGGAAGGGRRGWHGKLCLLGVFCMGHGCSARAEG